MIPISDALVGQITEVVYPNRTYKINFSEEFIVPYGLLSIRMNSEIQPTDRISGFVDNMDAVMQAIYLILSTERYQFVIYSWDYGVELLDLYGKPMSYVMAELPRRVTEALVQDNRITDVKDFTFEKIGKVLKMRFTVITTVGNVSTELEVAV